MEHAIEIRDLCVRLAGFRLEHISLDVPKGAVLGLIGKNGAGKTTLLKTLADFYIPESGSIRYEGLALPGNEEKVKGMIGVVYDSLFYPPNIKAVKIAKIMAGIYEEFDMDKWHGLMSRFGLEEKKVPAAYSKGMQMKFMLAMALARNPRILLLDEPTAGLDPAARMELVELIQEFMMDESHTVIFSTHITSDLDKIADYIALLADGKLVFADDKESLLDRYALVQVAKSRMTGELRSKMIGVKENSFGYIGLTKQKELFENAVRPAIEDLMIYGGMTDD